jgi:hypothetical protein
MYIRGDYLKKETKIKIIVSLPFELNHAITALYIQNVNVTEILHWFVCEINYDANRGMHPKSYSA